MIKIATWNVNSIRIRLDSLQAFINECAPDVILLQETKVEDTLFPLEQINNLGFEFCYYTGQKSYNGVAILSKIEANNFFSLNLFNDEKRHIAIKIKDLEVHNFYIPAGGDVPDTTLNTKFAHKLEYVRLIREWFITNRNLSNDKIVIGGDFNIAPLEHDVWSSTALKDVVSHTDVERNTLNQLLQDCSFTDSCRYFIPEKDKFYTWWSYRNMNWYVSDKGRRLDHIWVSNNLESDMHSIFAMKATRSFSRPSDHIPYMLSLDINYI